MRKPRFKKLSLKYVWHKRQRYQHLKHHPFVVPIVTLFVLLFASSIVLVLVGSQTAQTSDSHIVIVSYDGHRETIPTRAATVADLLQRLHVTLGEGDIVEPAANTPIPEDNFRVNVYRARPITIVDGVQQTATLSAATTGRSVAQQAGVVVYPEDNVETKIPTDILKEGINQQVVITRAVPAYLNLYGTPLAIRTQSKTVGGLLKDKHITLGEGESVQPSLNTPITPNVQVFVLRKDTQVETVEETVAAPVQIVDDKSLSYGTRAVRQQGVDGKKAITYLINSKTGEKQQIQSVVIQEPVPQIVARGVYVDIPSDRTGLMQAAGIGVDQYASVNYVISRESNWHPDARNSSGCIGLGQSCGSGLASACPNWQFDPVCQLRFFTGYADRRYGSWQGAQSFWADHGYW